MSGQPKTPVPCDCNWLANHADDGRWPIVFDPVVNEYHVTYSTPHGLARAIIRHCPWCGGKAPESKRGSLFAKIEPAEQKRLSELVSPLRSLDDVLRTLGPADYDSPTGSSLIAPETDKRGAEHEVFRTLIYERLSGTALVRVYVLPGDAVRVTFSGKYIGPREK